jgi:6-pyruvoyltetrahydropterin/6-carboxytetrahydropterin synthase
VFEVKVQGNFSAAHSLRDYQGDCEKLHGHNWLVEVAVVGKRAGNGMVVDFRLLKNILCEALVKLDHQHLNELDYFKTHNTTTENIAEYLFSEISQAMPDGLRVSSIKTWESPGSSITYRPGDEEFKSSFTGSNSK